MTVGLVSLALWGCGSAEQRKLGHYEDGMELLEKGQAADAAVAFGNALRIDENYADAHAGIADALAAQGETATAAAHLLKLVELQPERLEARLDLAELLIGLGDAETARVHADAALGLEPENARGLGIRSATALASGDLAAAVGVAREALARDPKQGLAWLTLIAERVRLEDFPGALERIAEAEAAVGADPVLSVIRATVYERTGDREGLGAELERMRAADPENDEIAAALARWHMQASPPGIDAAEALIRAIADRRPERTEVALGLVDFLNQTRGAAAARAELARRAEAEGPGGLFDRTLAAFDVAAGDRAGGLARLEAAIVAGGESERGDAARLALARLLDPVDDAARRRDLVAAVLSRDARNVQALTLRADDAIREDRYDAAIQDLHAALDGAPQDPDILELLAVAHERNGAPELARDRRAFAAQASNYAPDPTLRYAAVLMREGNAATAEGLLRDAVARAPDDRRLLGALAEARIALGDHAGAEELAARIEALGETGTLPERIRAAALIAAGQAAEGKALLEAAWVAGGAGADLETLVRAQVQAGETAKAEETVARALEAGPGNVTARLLAAELRLAAGDPAGARAAIEAGIAARPESGALRFALARTLEAAGDAAGAAAAVDAGLAVEPDHPGLRFSLARRLEQAGDVEGAIREYEAIYARYPSDMLVANNLASLLSDHRDDPASLARAAAVARRLEATGVPVFLDTYGWTLHRSGDHARAVEILSRSTEALSDEALAQYHLGMALEATGDAAGARLRLERALALAASGSSLPTAAAEAARAALGRLPAAAGQ